jgi:DNA-binding MarR family transcriptional regulator
MKTEGFDIRQFAPNYWGRLKQFQVPTHLFKNNVLSLRPKAAAVLMFLYFKARGRYKQIQRCPSPGKSQDINVVASQKEIAQKTGYSRNTVTSAMKELVAKKWLEPPAQRRFKRGELATNEYFLLHPGTGKRLIDLPVRPYFTLPDCIIRQDTMHWALNALSSAEVALYVTALLRADQVRANAFANDPERLRKMSGLNRGKKGSFHRAMKSLQEKGLLRVDEEQIWLCNPLTGEPPVIVPVAEADPANYYDKDGQPIILNSGNPEALLKWVEDSLPPGEVLHPEGADENKLRCPFHPDPGPSLNFNAKKNTFHCFGCGAKGTTRKLVMQLTGVSESEAIKQHAIAVGFDPVFEPDTGAEVTYDYRDEHRELLYQVLRYPGKRFSQRRPTPSGWIHNRKGVKKTLYNLPALRRAATVVITEGEKDADNVNAAGLKDFTGREVVATTSGGADSWQDNLADLLTSVCFRIPANVAPVDSRYVIVMPDADEPGQAYAQKIMASLDKRGVQYCVVTFPGYKDVSEYLEDGHTGQDLAQLIEEACRKSHGPRGIIQPQPIAYEEITI